MNRRKKAPGRGFSNEKKPASILEGVKPILFLDNNISISGSTSSNSDMLILEERAQAKLEESISEIQKCPSFQNDEYFLDVLDENQRINANTSDYYVVSEDENEDGSDSTGFGAPKTNGKDRDLWSAFLAQKKSKKYMAMLKIREKLPAFQYRKTIIENIQRNQVVLISGETGSLDS